jgi:hypothetical protein
MLVSEEYMALKSGRLLVATIALLVTFTSFLIVTAPAFGLECDQVLIPTKEVAQSDRTLVLSYLKLIDKKTFENIKSGASAGLSIPIVDSLVKASADWSDFQQRRSSFLSLEQFTSQESDSRSNLKTYLPEYVVDNWVKCKLENAGVAIFAKLQR